MLSFFANLFGYVLNFLYELCKNYGLAMILFSIIVKLLMLPLSIKQQKAMKKNSKIQNEMKQIQFKYKNDPEKANQEIMALYKRENMSPLSGCLSSIVQIILLFSIFYLVKSPLTYMEKMDESVIEQMKQVVSQQENVSNNYPEIAIIRFSKNLENRESVSEEQIENAESGVENNEDNLKIFKENKEQLDINMDLLGIDLSKVPKDNINDWKVLIIPVLYVISSFISIKYTTSVKNKKNKNDAKLITDGNEEKKEEAYDVMEDTNKMMSWMMPIMSVSIAYIAPLGLALYWFMNNILMIVERFVFDMVLKDDDEKEEAEKNG